MHQKVLSVADLYDYLQRLIVEFYPTLKSQCPRFQKHYIEMSQYETAKLKGSNMQGELNMKKIISCMYATMLMVLAVFSTTMAVGETDMNSTIMSLGNVSWIIDPYIFGNGQDIDRYKSNALQGDPDLTIPLIMLIWYGEKEPGGAAQLYGWIKNSGTAAVSSSFRVAFYIDGKLEDTESWSGGLSVGSLLEVKINFKWPNDMGLHTVSIKADSDNQIKESNENNNMKSVSDSITNPPNKPSGPFGPTTGKPGISYSYSAKAIDPDGDDVKLCFAWGDGTEYWTDYVDSGQSQSVSHSWSGDGTYNVRVKAQDKYGVESDWSNTLTVTIESNAAPYKPNRPTGVDSGRVRREYTYSSSSSDPDGDQIWFKWYWGDGETSDWLGPYDSGDQCEASHKWVDTGEYEIKVKAKDSKGKESDWSSPLSISMPKIHSYNPMIQPILKMLERYPFLQSLLLFVP